MKLIETCTLHLLAPTVPRNPWCLPSLQLNPHSLVGFLCISQGFTITVPSGPERRREPTGYQRTGLLELYTDWQIESWILVRHTDIPCGWFFWGQQIAFSHCLKKAKQDAYNRKLSSVKFGKRLFTNEIALLALLSSTNWCIAIVCNSDIVLCRQVVLQK